MVEGRDSGAGTAELIPYTLDPVIHPPKRLAIMAVLSVSVEADFRFLRDHLDVTNSDLSKQMATLDEAGYVDVSKTRGPGGSTRYRITKTGRASYQKHVDALNHIVAGTDAGE